MQQTNLLGEHPTDAFGYPIIVGDWIVISYRPNGGGAAVLEARQITDICTASGRAWYKNTVGRNRAAKAPIFRVKVSG